MTALEFSSNIGAPPVANVVVGSGASFKAMFDDGVVTLEGQATEVFRRGDTNHDGLYDIADGIWLLNGLFQGGTILDCDGANDANSDGQSDAADAIFIFSSIFGGGPPPAAPFPDCGEDPTVGPSACNDYGGPC